MDQLDALFGGFGDVFTPMNLLWVFVGCMIGTAVGVLPGLGSSMAVALLLPMTFALDPTGAFILFSAVYFGGLFGDSTMGILMNTPGQASGIATTFEGHKMAMNGFAPQALAVAAIGAFIGGMVSSVAVVFLSPSLADLSANFGSAEFFALTLLAFGAIASVVSDSPLLGVSSLVLGLMLATVGVDQLSGAERFTFGVDSLFDGVSLVIMAVGLLAVGELFSVVSRIHREPPKLDSVSASGARAFLSKAEIKEAAPAWARGTGIGLPFGVIPVGGADVPTFLAYDVERRMDRRREVPKFGQGALRGVAAPEAAGSSTTGLAIGALLALGLPVSTTAAIMLAAFKQYGIQPGPLLFEKSGDLVWPLLASFFLAMVALLIINLPFAQLWAKLVLVPQQYMFAGIAVFCGLGIYATSPSTFHLLLLLGAGLLGFLMKRYGIPLAPLLIGMVLGPLAEKSLREALLASAGSADILIQGTITKVLYGLLIFVIALKARQLMKNRVRKDV